jgi:polar amino acid transport system substrate-binding protein
MRMLFSHRISLLIETELNAKYRANKLGLDFTEMIKIKEIKELNNDLSIALNLESDSQLVFELQQAYNQIV